MGERRGTKALELWCRRMVDGYPGVKIDNMTTSWRDGLAFCAIIHHFRPDLIDFSKLTKGDIYYNNDLAFTVAEKHLGIPALLEPEDMVEYEVPDRLSILTYLAQFYRAFVTPQGSSPSRIVPKRPATTADRGIVSPASTSPPTKMVNRSGGVPRRDPCEKCGLPVFIAERLNVGKLLYHRTCFRCARCNSQLTLANYYETDSNQFCCETCPDEEPAKVQPTSFLDKPSVLSRSLSDEEKSASLKKKDSDDYSAVFESALENTDDLTLKKDSTLTKEFSSARSAFLTAQVVVSSSESDEEMPPELPKTKPPDISGNDNISDSVNSANKPETTVVYRTKVSDQLNAASAASLSPVKSVTKDNPSALDGRPTSVRDRMKQFEKAQSPINSTRSSPIRTQTDGKTSPIRASPTGSFEKAQSPINSTRSSPIRTQTDGKTTPIRASPTGSFEKAQSPTQTTRSSPIRTQPDGKTSPIRASPTGSIEKAQFLTQPTISSHIRTQSDDRTSPVGASLRGRSEKTQPPSESTTSSHNRTQSDDKTSPIRASPRGSSQRKSSPAREKLESRFSPIREKSDDRLSPSRPKTENLPTQFTKSKSSSPIKEKLGVAPSNETVVDSKPLPVRRKAENPTSTPKLATVQKPSPTKSPPPRPETLSIPGKLENRSTPHKAYPDSIKSPIREKSSPIKTREDFRRSTPNLSPRRSSIELPKVSELKRKFASPTVMEQSPKVPPLEAKPAEVTPATPTNLNFLLEKQIGLKKSKTTPVVNPEKEHIPPRRPFSDISIRSPSDPQIQLPRRLEENAQDLANSDVSALDSNVVDVGVEKEASKVVDDKCTDNVSEKLVAEDHRQLLGDGNLEDVPSAVDNKLVPERSDSDNNVDVSSVSKEPVELLHSSSKEDIPMEIVNTPEVINISDSIEEIIDTSRTINDSAITIEDSIIEISDDSKVEHLDDIKNEDEYPDDLNPFGDEEAEDKDMNSTKSSNPFDDDEDDEEIAKPIPAVRRKVKSNEEKNSCLNPFGDEEDEGEETKAQEKPKPTNRSKIRVKVLESDGDTPENLKNHNIRRITVNPFDADEKQECFKDSRKLVAAPKISFNPFWSDADEDGQEDEDEGGLPRPKPRKIRTSDTPEKQKNHQTLSTFGSSSSLSSVNSGVQSVRKKKPAPRPPILTPDHQESAQSSLTSSPNASVQHSPRLSTPKNRKTRRAPLPPSSTPNKTLQSLNSFGLTPIQHDGGNTGIGEQDWDKQKETKDEVNRNRQSQTFGHSDSDVPGNNQPPNYIPDKSTFGKWKRKKGPAPSRPVPQRRSIKQLPMTEIKKELDLIELQQQGLEKQGVRLEQIIRERCEGPNVNPEEIEPIDVDDLILQLFEVVNEKNEICRRQAELMYLRRQQRLEEEHAEVEYEIRCLMMQPEANKTDTDKAREEELINRLVNIVERRNEIIECLEMDRVRENDEDTSITNSLNTYAAKRDEGSMTPEPEILDKKDKKKKKKIKIKFMKKSDLDKDIDESETSSVSSGKEKKKKKFTLF